MEHLGILLPCLCRRPPAGRVVGIEQVGELEPGLDVVGVGLEKLAVLLLGLIGLSSHQGGERRERSRSISR